MELPAQGLRESDLQVGRRVVYPNQGVCLVAGMETKEIGGVKAEFLTMRREEDGATVMVPRQKLATIGLRPVAAVEQIQEILKFFEREGAAPELDWKIRHRTHSDKMISGSLQGTADVLKALHSLAERRPLPQKERELYDSARHLVVNELAVALAVSRGSAEDLIDFCLTPPLGSPRAQLKAQLKADREAAADAELLGELDADLGDLAELAADPTDEPPEPVAKPVKSKAPKPEKAPGKAVRPPEKKVAAPRALPRKPAPKAAPAKAGKKAPKAKGGSKRPPKATPKAKGGR